MSRTFYIQTVGCQMNVLDSELVHAELLNAGYEPTDDRRRADIILFNTCSVRAHAEDKVYSALGRLKHLKEYRPDAIIGVMGCMAQKDHALIRRRAPHVDLIVGPGYVGHIASLIEQRIAEGPREEDELGLVQVSLDRIGRDRNEVEASFERFNPTRVADARNTTYQAMLRIMFGCDKFCSYCIVPRVRGPEQSRPASEIVEEARWLADQGCLEVTLIGQAVNRYDDRSESSPVDLARLLYRLEEIDGLRRIKFVTNYPTHMTDELLRAVRDLPKVSPYLHVPAQSGSDRVLQRMRRSYTVAEYREMLDRIRATVPNAAVTSDFIVGFCGETEEDFQQTADLVREGRFKNSFIFKYSTREGTLAAERYEDDVPYDVKQRRNNELLDVQNAISEELNRPFVGRRVEILVEGPSKAAVKQEQAGDSCECGEGKQAGSDGAIQMVGRTHCDRIVVFDGRREMAGRIVSVEVADATAFTLFGRLDESGAE